MNFYATINDLVSAVKLWNDDYSLGLRASAFDATNEGSAWFAGNRQVTMKRLVPMQGKPVTRVEIVDYNGEPPNAEAESARQKLTSLLKTYFEEVQDYLPCEMDRTAIQNLSRMSKAKIPFAATETADEARKQWIETHGKRNFTMEQWVEASAEATLVTQPKEQVALATKTAEQADQEFFDSLLTASAAPDALTVPTSGAGDGQAGLGDNAPKPWDKIKAQLTPDELMILELWDKELSCPDIGVRISRSESRVRNILADLRKRYGVEIAPYRKRYKKTVHSG